MPYDDRKVSEGGNQGIDEEFSRVAPKDMFRVVGVDTFDGTDWVEGDFPTLITAQNHATNSTKGKSMLKMHIYDDTGKCVDSAGSF